MLGQCYRALHICACYLVCRHSTNLLHQLDGLDVLSVRSDHLSLCLWIIIRSYQHANLPSSIRSGAALCVSTAFDVFDEHTLCCEINGTTSRQTRARLVNSARRQQMDMPHYDQIGAINTCCGDRNQIHTRGTSSDLYHRGTLRHRSIFEGIDQSIFQVMITSNNPLEDLCLNVHRW